MSSRDRKPNRPARKKPAGETRGRGGVNRTGGKKSDAARKGGDQRKAGTGSKRAGGRSGGTDRGAARKAGATGRSGAGRQQDDRDTPAKKKLPAAAAGLPRHVVEALIRVTPPARQSAALTALAEAAEAFGEGQYHVAARKAGNAKELSSRDATIREILALAAYRIGDWQTALRELRTYRRLSGETTHMPVEMDVLRALNRVKDVPLVWEEFKRLDGSPAVKKEARVVYASYLIDEGDLDGAAEIIGRPKITDDPWPEDMRIWYVAARVSALRGDGARAKALANAILLEDPSFPGLDELDRLIESA